MTAPATGWKEGSMKWALAYACLGATAIVWGFIPVFQKKLLGFFSPVEYTFSRFFLTGIILLTWVLATDYKGLLKMVAEDFRPLVLTMFIGPLLAFLLQSYGIKIIPVGIASVIVALEPVFTYIFAVSVKQEAWNLKRMLSIGIALLGLILVVYTDKQNSALWQGVAVMIASTIVWGINTIISKNLVNRHSPVTMMAFNFMLGSLILVPWLGWSYLDSVRKMDFSMWMNLLYCVIPGTVIGFSVWYTSLKFVSASSASIALYLIPIASTIGGVLYLNETISLMKAIGLVIALLGVYLVSFRFKTQKGVKT